MNPDYDKYRPHLVRVSEGVEPPHWFAKLLALIFLGLCLMLGVVGLILPILPGIVFFGFAALLAAWLFPPLHRVLRRQPSLSPYLESTAGFARLHWRRQARVLGWLAIKMLLDSFRLTVDAIARLIRFATRPAP